MELGKLIKKIDYKYKKHKFKNIQFDSKKCKKGDVFFAIKGNKFDGNKFIDDAISRGAQTIVSSNKSDGKRENVLFINSKNPRKILTEAVSKIYNTNSLKIVAVTGTNGKSSISNFFFQILKLCKLKVGSIGTLGVHDGNKLKSISNTTIDPLSLGKILTKFKEKKIKNIVLEASSHGLKQHRLDHLKFDIGIFTNLSRDHLDYHKSFKDYYNSKMILFNNLMKKKSISIYDNDTEISKKINKVLKKNKLSHISVGNQNSDLTLKNHNFINNQQHIVFVYKKKQYEFSTNLVGKIQIKNLLMAIAAANKFIPLKRIIKQVTFVKPVNGRFEQVGLVKNRSKVFLDYAHTPKALETCINNLREQFRFSNISLVFGCGGERDKPKRKLMGKVADKLCDKIYLTDDNPRNENPKKIRQQIKEGINQTKVLDFSSRGKAINEAIKNLKSGDILIVAGKGHENYQEYRKKIFFSDRECILNSIRKKNNYLHNNWKTNIVIENTKNIKLKNIPNIKNASINSKEVKKNDIFFAIKGKNFDGNKFANESLNNGASISMVSKKYSKNNKIVKINNSLEHLTKLSKIIRKTSNIIAIGVTGSAGKTSLKELLGQSINKIKSTTYSRKSFNNKFGVPLSLFNIEKKNIFGVFEIGMDKKGEINKLSNLVKPNIAIITNISYAHIKNFKNLKEIAKAKAEIINNIVDHGCIVLNKDDKFFNFLKKIAKRRNIEILTFSKKLSADVQLLKIKKNNFHHVLFVRVFGDLRKFKIKKNNIHIVENLLAVITIISKILKKNIINENIFYKYKTPSGRGDNFVFKMKKRKVRIIDESYNSNPLSLKFAINRFSNLKINKNKKNILLGDMLELGKYSTKLHIDASKYLNKAKINKVYVYGNYIKKTFNRIYTHKKGRILKNKKDIFELIHKNIKNNDYLMIKGSKRTGLNNIVNILKKRTNNAL